MLHVPVLRAGRPYRSLKTVRLTEVGSGDPVAEVSQANAGLIGRDLAGAKARARRLQEFSVRDLLDICKRAGKLFVEGELPLDSEEGTTQTADEFVRVQSATTGMPRRLCLGNMEKIRFVLDEMERVLGGLTRGLDLRALDEGWIEQDGRPVSYLRQADTLGAILPSNSPGVHSLWIPSIALKVPLALKPGREEPWTPLRISQALLAAGCPPEAIGFYPADYSGATEILMRCQRSMFFGDAATVASWKGENRVQLHGPGWSKVVIGSDKIDQWERYLDLMVTSISENGGRSCVNASGVWVPSHGREIAEALARRMATIDARPLDHAEAGLAAFPNPEVAHRVSDHIDSLLCEEGAEDLTALHREGDRVVEVDGCTLIRPKLIWCTDPSDPLAATELLFPFAAVVEAPQDELLERIGPTLVVTAVTDDEPFRRELMVARNVERLNIGALPTSRVSWDQPHEGNLFEHLYKQRAFQAGTTSAA
jgi:acyl-CoA reductase-like NAD-dependent aldehyde dehydrogenase